MDTSKKEGHQTDISRTLTFGREEAGDLWLLLITLNIYISCHPKAKHVLSKKAEAYAYLESLLTNSSKGGDW